MAMPLPFRSIHEITLRIVLFSETTSAEKSFVTLSSIERFCRDADHGRPRGHVLCYHRPGPNGNFVADFKILEDRGARADEATRTHLDPTRHVDTRIEHATVRDTHIMSVGAVKVEEVERTDLDIGGENVSRAENVAAAEGNARLIAYDARVNQVRKSDVRAFSEAHRDLVDDDGRTDTDRCGGRLGGHRPFGAAHAILADFVSDTMWILFDEPENVPLRRDAVNLLDQKCNLARQSTTTEDDDVLHSSNEALVRA